LSPHPTNTVIQPIQPFKKTKNIAQKDDDDYGAIVVIDGADDVCIMQQINVVE